MNVVSNPEVGSASSGLFHDYLATPGVYDEMETGPGLPRPHWQKFRDALTQFGASDMNTRWKDARRMLEEHGVTYNVYADAQGMDRPWEFDLVPLLIPAAEWRQIEAGLIQRAHLMNTILADLYGPQRLLREGRLPPALVYANPAFLRACHGIRVPGDVYLFRYGVDLARAPDGQWWVLADRTQAPSGAGYALENRFVISRVLPGLYRSCQVQRLATFFQMERDALRGLATRHQENPRVVLLTPGPYNETYFEQVYLARYLGFTLVEGADLAVRDRCVFLKTLEGLQPVDVIIRRVDDTFCDPLELRTDSFLGVPGLVDAVRAGNVAVANALGSGLVETPSLPAFLPGLCRHLLGEELKLPSVGTWWCGQEREFQYVAEHLDQVVVKRAFASSFAEPVFSIKLKASKRAALLAKLRASPLEFVGQEQVALSHAPVWTGRRMVSRPVVLRAYVAAVGDAYAVLPGGLARVSASQRDPVVSMQSGGGSKDTWILAEGPVPMVTLVPSLAQSLQLDTTAAEVPSRVAENLYWLGRYAERLEDTMRRLRCTIRYLSAEAGPDATPERAALVRMLVWLGLLPAQFCEQTPLAELEEEIIALVNNEERAGSVRYLLTRMRQIALIVRDRFSTDSWRIFLKLQTSTRLLPGHVRLLEVQAQLNALVVDLAAFSGIEMENMNRGHGWRFLDIGRRLERALAIATVIRAALLTEPGTGALLEPLLIIADSVMTYRRRFFAQPQWPAVLLLLLLEEKNPRSLAFQLKTLAEHTAVLPSEAGALGLSRELKQLTTAQEHLRRIRVQDLSHPLDESQSQRLVETLFTVADEIRRVSDNLAERYFSHTAARVS